MIRKAVPLALVPLCLIASVLASAPWLRSFPANVLAIPIFGAAVLSVLIPVVVTRVSPRRLWLSLVIDVVAFVVFALLVVLHDVSGFADLIDGLYHGPSQVLTFALPLVSPRSLMIAPVALTWLVGALAGECIARRWFTVLPYAGLLVAFALAYAATIRAGGPDAGSVHLRETLLAAGLLVTLLLLRAAQAWVREDENAETTQADGVLPLRGLAIGLATAVVLTLVVAFAVQSDAFVKAPVTPQRVPAVNDSNPVSPVAYISGLRPIDQRDSGKAVFTVRTSAATPGYFPIANVDYYDGDGWSFTRTFRPSGGVLPADPDSALAVGGPAITQQYQISAGPLSSAPWMPFLYRPNKVTGIGVNIDPASGMIVPTTSLAAGNQYTVRSNSPSTTFEQLPTTAGVDTTTPSADIQLLPALPASLDKLVTTFAEETGVPRYPAVPFLQALERDLRTKYGLVGAATTTPTPSATRTTTTPKSSASKARKTATPKPTATPSVSSAPPGARAGSTSFADVLASILGSGNRTASPEQYATLVALIARQLGVPARLATGFRLVDAGQQLPAGSYDVRTAEAWTWVEIPVIGSGWVVLDPSPGQYNGARQQPSVGVSASPLPTVTPSQGAEITKGNGGHAIAPKSEVPHQSRTSNASLLVAILIGLGLVVLLLLLFALLRKPMRARRRRGVADPRLALLGAWYESIDVLAESGLPELSNLTNTEIAELTYHQFGADPAAQARYLGERANAVSFSSRATVLPDEAAAAWRVHQDLRKTVHRGLGFRGRVAAELRYHRNLVPHARASPESWASDAAATATAARSRSRQHRLGRLTRLVRRPPMAKRGRH
ncbi:MAG: transglutaminaseTgpA domain-containing protein [Jatrophihabitantaceae bacterium]